MSDTGMVCQNPSCGQPTSIAWSLCDSCKSAKQQLVAKSANKHKGSAVAVWQVTTQSASKVEDQSYGYFKEHAAEIAQLIYSDCGQHINSTEVSDFGDQYTVKNFGKTVTLDYQGCRKGGNTYWLDYQGQVGSAKATGRFTYFQVMMQCGAGVPDVDIVELALTKSQGKGLRSVVYKGTTDRPTQ
jgi:hypothetical protein